MRLLLDEGVTVSVAEVFRASGHEVILFEEALIKGSSDQLVCAAAEANNAILVAQDGDMKQMARHFGLGSQRFKKLSLIKLSCREHSAARRVEAALSLIEHEWNVGQNNPHRKLHIEIGDNVIRTVR